MVSIHLVTCLLIAAPAPPVDLLAISSRQIGDPLPPGWSIRRVRGQEPPDASIRRADDGTTVFAITGAGRAAWFAHELAKPIAVGAGRLAWSWRVTRAPADADLQVKARDDSAIRFFVVFGKPGGLFGGSGRVIFYSHGNGEPDHYARDSHVSDRMHIIRIGGRSDRGEWRDHGVDPFADYRRIWQREPPAITAVGLMQDTDQTRQHAEAEVRRIEWQPR